MFFFIATSVASFGVGTLLSKSLCTYGRPRKLMDVYLYAFIAILLFGMVRNFGTVLSFFCFMLTRVWYSSFMFYRNFAVSTEFVVEFSFHLLLVLDMNNYMNM